MKATRLLWAFALWRLSSASFVLYGGRDLGEWSEERGVSMACMAALNATLDCADTFLESIMQLEHFQWHVSNMTEGCTASCENDIDQWVSDVQAECSGAEMREMGNIIRPWSLPLIYQHKYQLGCMRGSASEWCWLDSLGWQGSDIIQYDEDLCITGDPDFDADICFDEGFNQFAVEANDVRLTNLYEEELLCSDCFLKIFHHRLRSPVLEKSDFTDYLIEQHGELEAFCTTSMPLTTSTQALFLRTMPIPTPTASGGAPPAAVTTCAGQLIEPSPSQLWCDNLAIQYNVPTGDLIVLTNDWSCLMSEAICAPPPCPLTYIGFEQEWTCESLRALISTEENNVTAVEFASWNRRIVGTCDHVRGDQYICSGPPGGQYEFPAPVYVPTSASYYTTATPAMPTHTGTTDNCGKYYDTRAGDTCSGIVLQESITLDDFLDLNPQIWPNCTNLWLDYSYCVAPVLEPPVSETGQCGPDNEHAICEGSGYGDCCSYSGQCGSGEEFCGAGNCYGGECMDPVNDVSENGSCGPDNNDWVCGGEAVWGKCCSIYGWCGNSEQHCGPGLCYGGQCDPDEGGPSTDGSCGPLFPGDRVCDGTQFGSCCSIYGYCGSGPDFCKSSRPLCSEDYYVVTMLLFYIQDAVVPYFLLFHCEEYIVRHFI
ncbi:carbohydrate-binding module family 18 protein [Sodiomyces alcalophilus JCM 7366]|uniref:carbohydrate-binding module family 18 protein n=1 Tax=Sodiomyces alcalophilus JCM 7366 TaxID=591952 RepID=UPI0039B64237